MDTHFVGPAVNGYGAVPVQRILRTKYGTTPAGSRVLLKTTGASPANPLLVELLSVVKTAFNGTTPVVSITSTLLDGTDAATEIAIGGIVTNGPFQTRLITADRIYKVLYTPATGSPTAGDIYSAARVAGPGTTT